MVGCGRGNYVGYFWKNLEKSSEPFFHKVSKTSILAVFCRILPENRIFTENRIFSEKSGRAIFFVFFTRNIPENLGEILGADSEIIRYERTDERTDGRNSPILRPLRFITGDQ